MDFKAKIQFSQLIEGIIIGVISAAIYDLLKRAGRFFSGLINSPRGLTIAGITSMVCLTLGDMVFGLDVVALHYGHIAGAYSVVPFAFATEFGVFQISTRVRRRIKQLNSTYDD